MIDLRVEDGTTIAVDQGLVPAVTALAERVPGIWFFFKPITICFQALEWPTIGQARHRWTTGEHTIAIDPRAWANLSDIARVGLLAHEVAHLWLMRRGGHSEDWTDKQAIDWGFAEELASLDQEARG